MNCNQGSEIRDLADALTDVEEVARAAVVALTSSKINGNEDVFKAAYDPLMYSADQPGLLATFGALATLGSSPTLTVQIYCRENHLRYHNNDPKSYWEDKDYYSRVNNKRMAIGAAPNSKDKPGAKGSYTTLGFKWNDQYDCSGNAHIYLASTRMHPPADTDRDLRRYPVKLLHAIGDVGPPDPTTKKRAQLIKNGPSGVKVYGWAHCNSRRIQNEKNNDIADCITFLAQAIYLQIEGKDTY